MKRAPVLFVGHGSPMNALEDNPFTARWKALGEALPRPQAIVAVSAHWFTPGTLVSHTQTNRTIYDMYGFPDALYRMRYDAPGAPELARQTRELLGGGATLSDAWGLDHGSWSVLAHLYPKADIPVFQVSVNRDLAPQAQFDLGRALRPLRDENVMIFASGNVVHNLGMVSWDTPGGFGWADEFDLAVRNAVVAREFDRAVAYRALSPSARLAVPTADHYAPLLYALGASDGNDTVTVFNDARVMGSLSMTGYLFE